MRPPPVRRFVVAVLAAVSASAQSVAPAQAVDDQLAIATAAAARRLDEAAALALAAARQQLADVTDAGLRASLTARIEQLTPKIDPVLRAAQAAGADAAAKVRTVVSTYEQAGWTTTALEHARFAARIGASHVAPPQQTGFAAWFSAGEPNTLLRDWRRSDGAVRCPSLAGTTGKLAIYLSSQRARSDALQFAADVVGRGDGKMALVFALRRNVEYLALVLTRRGQQLTAALVDRHEEGPKTLAQVTFPAPAAADPTAEPRARLSLRIDGRTVIGRIGERELRAELAAGVPAGFLGFAAWGLGGAEFAPTFTGVEVAATPAPSPIDPDPVPAEPPPTFDSLRQRTDDAVRSGAAGPAEPAAAALRAVRAAAIQHADPARGRQLLATITAAIDRVDPADAPAQKTLDEAARDLLRAARVYSRRKWHRLALPWFELAAESSPRTASKALAEAQKLLRDAAPAKTAAIDEWFADGEVLVGEGAWEVRGATLFSPTIAGASVGFHSSKSTDQAYRVEIAARSGPERAKVGVVFAAQIGESLDYYLLELLHEEIDSELRVLHLHDYEVQQLASVATHLTSQERSSFVELWLQVKDGQITFGIGEVVRGATPAVTKDLAGRLGCYLSGDAGFQGPVALRSLRTQPL